MIYKEVEHGWEKLPSDWNKLIPLGGAYNELELMGLNWKDLTSEHLQSLVDTEPQWKNEVRQVKRRLKEKGWLDENQPHGYWCLNSKGRYEIETWLYY